MTIEYISIKTGLRYNLKTDSIKISTTTQYQDPIKRKICREKNKDKINRKNKIYRNNNRKRINAQVKLWYENNQDQVKAYRKSRRSINTTDVGSLEYRIKLSCANQGILVKDWDGFTHEQKYCSLFNNKFKELIRNRFHNKCYLCNKSKEDNGRNLDVHHVNYDKSCLCQNTCEFVPLCISCHAKTNKNRQYWEDLIMCYLYPERYYMIDF